MIIFVFALYFTGLLMKADLWLVDKAEKLKNQRMSHKGILVFSKIQSHQTLILQKPKIELIVLATE